MYQWYTSMDKLTLQIASYACLHCWFYVYVCSFIAEEIFSFVSWPDEDNDVSVISNIGNKISGSIIPGATCEVYFRKKSFPAVVHARSTVCEGKCFNFGLVDKVQVHVFVGITVNHEKIA